MKARHRVNEIAAGQRVGAVGIGVPGYPDIGRQTAADFTRPAGIDINFSRPVGIECILFDARSPGAKVKAAYMSDLDRTLDREIASRVRNPAPAVIGNAGDVARYRQIGRRIGFVGESGRGREGRTGEE